MTTFRIGSSVDANYTTITSFMEDTIAALPTDDNAPYIGLLEAETHDFSGYYNIATDASHYYILKPLDKKWIGTTSTTNCATINCTDSTIEFPSYTKIQNCIITNEALSSEKDYYIIRSLYCEIFGCLFKNITAYYEFNKLLSLLFGDLTMGITIGFNTFINCVWDGSYLNGASVNSGCVISYSNAYLINCLIMNSSYDITSGDAELSFGQLYNSLIENNTFVVASGNSVYGNGFTNNNFDFSLPSYNLVEYDFVSDLISGLYFENDNTPSIYNPGINITSINDVPWPYLWYDRGLLYFLKNQVLLRQNGGNLVFTVDKERFYDIV